MRFSPGVYTLVNRYDYDQYPWPYYLDNQRYILNGDSMLTVAVYDNLIFTPDGSMISIDKIANNPQSIVGNVSMFSK